MDIGRESCHDNTVFSITELIIESLAYHFFTWGIARAFGIGTVRHKQKHTLIAIFRKAVKFRNLSVNRGLVKFKVAGVNNKPDRRTDGQCYCIRNTVVDTHETKLKSTG